MNLLEIFAAEAVSSVAPLFHKASSHQPVAVSSAQLLGNVARVAAALRNLGVKVDSRVLILPANSIESFEAVLAVLAVGAVAVPVNPSVGSVALARLVADVKPVCCISEDSVSTSLYSQLRGSCANVIMMERGVLAENTGYHRYEDLRSGPLVELAPQLRADDDPALLLHTSGSTGLPKRIYRTHGQLKDFIEFNHLLFSQYAQQLANHWVPNPLITVQPMSHLSGIGYCLEGLYSGTPVHLLRQFDASVVVRLIGELRARFLYLIPSLYELLLLELAHNKRADVTSLRYCLYGGEPCSQQLRRRIEERLGVKVLAAYGLTECLVGCGHSRLSLESERIPTDSCGKVLFGEMRLVDDQGLECTECGELWVRNGTIPKRSIDGHVDPRVTVDGWFRTGDVLSRDVEGNFYHRGRTDDMFMCNGNNVYPLQVEQILLEHLYVQRACVVPIRNRRGHTIPAAAVCCTEHVESKELIDFVRSHGPAYAVPAVVEISTDLPVAASGKLDRAGIRAHLQEIYEKAVAEHERG